MEEKITRYTTTSIPLLNKHKREHAPDYSPNFEVGKRRIATSIPAFKKDIDRKPMHKISITQNENYFDYDHYAKENN